jgi:hypothetical protein
MTNQAVSHSALGSKQQHCRMSAKEIIGFGGMMMQNASFFIYLDMVKNKDLDLDTYASKK